VYTSDQNKYKLFGLCGNYTAGDETDVFTFDRNMQNAVPPTVSLQGVVSGYTLYSRLVSYLGCLDLVLCM
jgi:hypothetical protein